MKLKKEKVRIIILPKYEQTIGSLNTDGDLVYEYGVVYHIGAYVSNDVFVDVCSPGRSKEEAIENLCHSLPNINHIPYDIIDIDGFNEDVWKSIAYFGC